MSALVSGSSPWQEDCRPHGVMSLVTVFKSWAKGEACLTCCFRAKSCSAVRALRRCRGVVLT